MAAKRRPLQNETTRQAIKSTLLVKRLQAYSLTPRTDPNFEKVDMEPGQVRAALGLLAKTVPDMSHIEHAADPAAPPKWEIHITGIAPADKTT